MAERSSAITNLPEAFAVESCDCRISGWRVSEKKGGDHLDKGGL